VPISERSSKLTTPRKRLSDAPLGPALGHTSFGHPRTPLVVCGGHSQEVRRLFAGCLRAPTRKKSKEYHGTLDLCRLPGGQMAKVELHALR
jgi:hypothetical protein